MAKLADLVRKNPGKLSVVGTPIGNLGDVSKRMIEVLDSSDVVYCEDTRVSSKLLRSCHITVSLERCDEHVIEQKIPQILERISCGEHVSFVSDAGMPCISDPGQKLVDAVLLAGHVVEVVPGPSALTCAVAKSGFRSDHIYFEGFLPRKEREKHKRLILLQVIPGVVVLYESPHRVLDTLEMLRRIANTRKVALVRELTKVHEECLRGYPSDLLEELRTRDAIKGECVLVLDYQTDEALQTLLESNAQNSVQVPFEQAVLEGLQSGSPKAKLARRLSKEYKKDRAVVYDYICEVAKGS